MLIFVGLTAHAQQKINFGVHAGASMSEFSNFGSNSMQPGAQAGVFGEYNFSSPQQGLYFNIGLQWSLKSYKTKEIVDGSIFDQNPIAKATTTTSTVCLNYLEMPFHIGYKFPVSKKVSFFIEGGPYISYAAWGKSKLELDGKTVKSSSDIFGDGEFNRFDYGLSAEVGLLIDKHYRISVSYEHGFRNQYESEKKSKSCTNNTVMLNMGYIF